MTEEHTPGSAGDPTNAWDADDYDTDTGFVAAYGESGLRDWLDVFGDSLFAGLDEAVVSAVEDRLRDRLYDPGTETWTADYRRLRFRAVRE
jgi:hypothetical protein